MRGFVVRVGAGARALRSTALEGGVCWGRALRTDAGFARGYLMAASIDFTAVRDLAADPETVFDFVSDPLNDPAWCPLVKTCELVSGDGPAAGSVYRWDQVVGEDQSAPMEFTIDVFERPSRLEWSLDNDMMGYRSTMTFEPVADGGTRVTQHNQTTVKVAPDEMTDALTEQARGINAQQFDNLDKLLS